MSDEIREVVAAAWAKNREVVVERMQLIADALDDAERGVLDGDARAAAVGAAHKLAGSLGMYGFHGSTATAARVEAYLGGAEDDIHDLRDAVRMMATELYGDPPAT